ncbi:MAG TPA: ribbon-helix-helix protein, CopG family [Thermoanaerobaculia bacterium]|jgi:Arc/MetJ-type ribon-helix-helix transcriptional regulator
MVITVRLDPDTRRKLDKLTRAHRVSRSELVRRAIQEMAKEHPATEKIDVYERMKDHIGKFPSGRSDLSQNTGEKFHQIALEKHRRRQKG